MAALAGIGLVLALVFLSVVLFTWPAMIMFGVVHSFWAFIPAFGFWQTLAVVVLAKLLSANVSASS